MKTKFEADHKNSGLKLGVEMENLNSKGLCLEFLLPLLIPLTPCFLAIMISFSLTAEAKTAKKYAATPAKKTTTHQHHLASAKKSHSKTNKNRNENETKSVKTEHVVRDKHGRIIRRETALTLEKVTGRHKRHTALQKEEQVVTAKEKIEPQSAPENQELPSEYHDFQKAYSLYDEGTNARLSGKYSEAVTQISRALSLVPSNAHGGPSVLVLNMEYDLAQAAESSGEFSLAARYYARALADRPNFPEASVHLARVLALSGKMDDALRAARDGVARSPNDARVHSMLAILLNKNGQITEATLETRKAQSMLSLGSSRTYVQPGPGSSPSFKSNFQNILPSNNTTPSSSLGEDGSNTGGTGSAENSKNPQDEGFMP